MSQLQVTSVLRIVGNKGRQVIRETYGALSAGETRADIKALKERAAQICSGVPLQTLRYAGAPRSVASFDIPGFVRLAQGADAVIVMACAVGDTVPDGALLLRVFGAGVACRTAVF